MVILRFYILNSDRSAVQKCTQCDHYSKPTVRHGVTYIVFHAYPESTQFISYFVTVYGIVLYKAPHAFRPFLNYYASKSEL
jgi:hypothetical protein